MYVCGYGQIPQQIPLELESSESSARAVCALDHSVISLALCPAFNLLLCPLCVKLGIRCRASDMRNSVTELHSQPHFTSVQSAAVLTGCWSMSHSAAPVSELDPDERQGSALRYPQRLVASAACT